MTRMSMTTGIALDSTRYVETAMTANAWAVCFASISISARTIAPIAVTERRCENCDRVWRTTSESPCDCPPEEGPGIRCIERALGMDHHNSETDVDEVVARSCDHGVEYDLLCKGCGHKVSGWGVGAAGFLELCGCVPDQEK